MQQSVAERSLDPISPLTCAVQTQLFTDMGWLMGGGNRSNKAEEAARTESLLLSSVLNKLSTFPRLWLRYEHVKLWGCTWWWTAHLMFGTALLERCVEPNPTLLSRVLIYFHINPLLWYLTCKVFNIRPCCQRTDSCVSWHQWSEAGQYCAVCRCDLTPVAWWDWHGQAIGPAAG